MSLFRSYSIYYLPLDDVFDPSDDPGIMTEILDLPAQHQLNTS